MPVDGLKGVTRGGSRRATNVDEGGNSSGCPGRPAATPDSSGGVPCRKGSAPMIIRDGLATLEIVERSGVFHPTLVWDDDDVVLIDTALPDRLPSLAAAASTVGIELGGVDRIIITHQDIDHIGSLPEVVRACKTPPEVITHVLTKPYVEGEKRLTKLTPERIAAAIAAAPEDQRASVRARLESPPRARVDTTVIDGQRLPYCGGITVISTPGHTPDHTSLYLHHYKVLVAGDALRAENGELFGPPAPVTHDMDLAMASLARFGDYDIESVICFHGGIVSGEVNARIEALAAEPPSSR
jgi:glyoxylase-like metal-dependent hydrolase (beta-lactamase superfamily II)